jgi:hypothetical protein
LARAATWIQPACLPMRSVRQYCFASTTSTPVIARFARKASIAGQSYGGR